MKHFKMSIKWTLISTNGVLVGVIFATLTTVFLITSAMDQEGITINLAGRQRMLSQKMTKELLIYSNAPSTDHLLTLETSIWAFNETLVALITGGIAPKALDKKNPDMLSVDMPSLEVRAQLEKVREIWAPLYAMLRSLGDENTDVDTLRRALTNKNMALLQEMNRAVFLMSDASDEHVKTIIHTVTGAGVVAIVIGVWVALAITRILSQVESVRQALDIVASGDLTHRIELVGKPNELDQIAININSLSLNFVGIVRNIIEQVSALSAAISQISATSAELAASSSETSVTISEVSSTVEEVRQTSYLAEEKSDQMIANGWQVSRTSQEGREASEKATSGMHNIRAEMGCISTSILQLSEQIANIDEIIDVVSDLADQSNLLSVNAAIEATKAGAVGKGFAVVAQEVKSLASQSRKATGQIKSILNDIKKASHLVVTATERGSNVVQEGVTLNAKSGESIAMLEANAVESANAAEQFGISNRQQLTGMEQLVTAITSINDATRQNVDGARQLETAARDLDTLGRALKTLTVQFKV